MVIASGSLPRMQTGRFKPKSYSGDYMRAGELAEKIVRDWLLEHPEVVGVVDVSQLREIQRIDTDIIVKLNDGTHPLAEIKWDRHLGVSGKVLLEVLRFNHKAPQEAAGVLGWTLRTEARWILYFAPALACVYQFKTAELRRCLQAYTDSRRAETEFIWVDTDRVKSTLCVLLPEADCGSAYQVHDVIEYARRYIPNIDQLRLRFAPQPLQF